MKDNDIIAKNIKKMRESSGFTQDNIADFLNIKRSTYSNYETGNRELPLSIMEKLADLYGCDMYDLYSDDEKVIQDLLVTAFRADDVSPEDMKQIAAFKRIVRNSLKMDSLLSR